MKAKGTLLQVAVSEDGTTRIEEKIGRMKRCGRGGTRSWLTLMGWAGEDTDRKLSQWNNEFATVLAWQNWQICLHLENFFGFLHV